jgi:hypothetical protein
MAALQALGSKDQLPGGFKSRGIALRLPEFQIERAVEVFQFTAPFHDDRRTRVHRLTSMTIIPSQVRRTDGISLSGCSPRAIR